MARRLVSWLLDDTKILILILLNAAVLFAQTFSQLAADDRHYLELVDDVFTVVFLVECLVKTQHLGWAAYWRSNWNKFDFILIMLATPSVLLELAGLEIHASVILVLRVARSFKLFRSLRFLPGIDGMVQGIVRALRASLILVVGFVLGLFMISLISAKLFGQVDPAHYGDPLRALYSTFKIFTVEGWYEIPEHVAGQLGGVAQVFTKIFFALVLLVCGILGLSLVNSVFVDAMVSDNNNALETKIDALQGEIVALRSAILQLVPHAAAPSAPSEPGRDP